VEAGAHLVNDVTGLERDEMVALVAELGVAACAMHMRGSPRTMQREPVYDDVMAEVLEFLEARLCRAEAAGIPRTRVLVDVGIGFGKTFEHNLFLLRHAQALRLLGAPVLMGTSRKAFLGALTGKAPSDRDGASAAVVAAIAARGGADLVRVHDVASAREAAAVADAVAGASHGGRLFEPPETGPRAEGVGG
jgi:dihydropteroate synthase